MTTPFGAFLATKVPKLKHVYLYVPTGGEKTYCTWGPTELETLVAYKCIERLSYVFLGSEAARALRRCKDSDDCFSRLFGLLTDEAIENHLFNLAYPDGAMDEYYGGDVRYYGDDLRTAVRLRRRVGEMWAIKNAVPIEWKWADRNIDMGSAGFVQAVCELKLKRDITTEETHLSMESVRNEKGIRRVFAEFGRRYASLFAETMESTGETTEPVARATIATAKQSFHDLFVWKQRVEIRNEYGEVRTGWHKPLPLRNPISLLAQLPPSGWLCFIVGVAAWTADAFDFLRSQYPNP
ncbi:Uu.00g112040.m01.CDS01 [Anthostomella pinea]|uniref:Uu.00g112040.m01.CDS01 n=1 Tax=Anthostomella pinea TaxID=933095 RepID=A0AAI8YGF5_9PEZI|nr:Uu.00g112040.m01.CDS01 [Anthostomella pinea]